MSTLSQFMAGSVKSVQRGVATFDTTVVITISSVNTSKAIALCSYGPTLNSVSIELASSTSIVLRGSETVTAYWQVIEYY
jgi:hypothetical protein